MTLNLRFSPEVEAALKQRAASAGKPLEQIVVEAVEEQVRPLASETISSEEKAKKWQEWVARMQNDVAKSLPPGAIVDDSRESIYDGRGE
jgi:hypothetical protein